VSDLRSIVRGVGGYLPDRIVTNDELAKTIDTSDEWIEQRVGIKQRHIAAEGEFTSDLAVHAARRALDNARLSPDDIDLIIVGTTTPDYTYPATATLVQNKLGMHHGFAFDIQAVCSGFVYAMVTADSYLKNGMAKRALVIGAETNSRILDWTDRTTCVLFGDGAGAVVVELGGDGERGILASSLRSDGHFWDKLYVDGGPSTTGTVGKLRMLGNQVFKHAVINISEAIHAAAKAADIQIADVDWFIPHQANQRILAGVAHRVGLDEHKVISTVATHANTSAASIPLAFAQGIADGRIKPGQLLLLEAMGGGLTWGACVLRL